MLDLFYVVLGVVFVAVTTRDIRLLKFIKLFLQLRELNRKSLKLESRQSVLIEEAGTQNILVVICLSSNLQVQEVLLPFDGHVLLLVEEFEGVLRINSIILNLRLKVLNVKKPLLLRALVHMTIFPSIKYIVDDLFAHINGALVIFPFEVDLLFWVCAKIRHEYLHVALFFLDNLPFRRLLFLLSELLGVVT